MSHDVDAVYDDGVFRPIGPIALPDGAKVRLHVDSESGASKAMLRQRADLDDFRRVMAALPVESPTDGFSGADHDRLLYGAP
jgi:predicted DNA-binding antitoxin AbrB/MazE fold protein